MANWQYNAIADLKEYEAVRASLDNIPDAIKAIEIDMQLAKGISYEKTPVQGGISGREDKLIDYIDRKSRLAENLKVASMRTRRIERGLGGLSNAERMVLQRFFIRRESGHISRLCGELGYEERNIYRIKDEALKKFTLAMFGVTDL